MLTKWDMCDPESLHKLIPKLKKLDPKEIPELVRSGQGQILRIILWHQAKRLNNLEYIANECGDACLLNEFKARRLVYYKSGPAGT